MSEVIAKRAKSTTAEDTNIWVDPAEYASGTKNQSMYK